MDSISIRETFLAYFKKKQHLIVDSAPMVIKNDPSLMFTNAGMNQFKDIFLGNSPAKSKRIADTQKCLRVSGKHNDLEEVGKDTYHHTMFEMLGNWSFGDYFKKEAIEWAWELLTGVYKINKDSLYVTIFAGDSSEGLEMDNEALSYWKNIVPEDRIIKGSRKDNFWEMGETGPCGPCSEIHVDLREEAERKKVPGESLVNKGNPLVIEIWNLVFIEFNRKQDGTLTTLPAKHVDTGMGFERLCMVLQNKKSNYDTDVFQPLINEIAARANTKYGLKVNTDIAIRVIADHLRAVSFAIADGQLPSNNKAGYVIRRILRRAVRYGYTFLGIKEPFLCELLPVLVSQMGNIFKELKSQENLIKKVIAEEENAFLRTLSNGIIKFENYIASASNKTIEGSFAFELFDTYGFPVDLTQLMASEKGFDVDMEGFNRGMEEQKNRSRAAGTVDADDWIVLREKGETEFVGYDSLEAEANIIKYRKVKSKNKEFFQLVLDRTPFYAESGGQAGDKGWLLSVNDKINILDTKKENNLIIHIVEELPADVSKIFTVKVDEEKRKYTANNHSATHLLHKALKMVLGEHIEQKGSYVDEERLRFDFSHFSKLTEEEILNTERLVNEKIRENIKLEEQRNIPVEKAKEMGAVALFGEKYGDFVRTIAFDRDFSIELCGGTHVSATGNIGLFKIVSESAIAAGVRRIEAITSFRAEEFCSEQNNILEEIKTLLKNPKDIVKSVQSLVEQNSSLQKQLEEFSREKIKEVRNELLKKIIKVKDINFISERLNFDPKSIKDLCFSLRSETTNLFMVVASEYEGKPAITVMVSDNLVKEKGLNASTIVKELANDIEGSGGGQAFFATAGGKNSNGLDSALARSINYIK
jgi:alanyl-tRNA synthetase